MRTRKALARLLLALSLLAWLVPSDVPRLIVRWEEVVLGRYSEPRFVALLLATPLLWLLAYALLASLRVGAREATFRAVAILIGVGLAVAIADVGLRWRREPRYLEQTVPRVGAYPAAAPGIRVRRRPADRVYEMRYDDVPMRARSYPDPPPGHPSRQVTLTTDARGFRNRTPADRYEVVTVGDSFAEGSGVSDDEPWPMLLGEMLGRPVYNLGMSGAGPPDYVGALRAYGAELAPKLVILMVYEGNDFKSARYLRKGGEEREPRGIRIGPSPLLIGFRLVVIPRLARINGDGPVRGMERLAWMPLAIPAGPAAKHYAFRPKRLTRLDIDETTFTRSEAWRSNTALLRMFKAECERLGARMILAYAPSKPHVVMPLARPRPSLEELAAFIGYSRDRLSVPADRFAQEIPAKLDDLERVVREFSEAEGIDFVSPTAALRRSVARGRQVYFTYDQHWTELGHEDVARVLYAHLAGAGEATGWPPGGPP
jgi:hypothetical protein